LQHHQRTVRRFHLGMFVFSHGILLFHSMIIYTTITFFCQ